MNTDKNTVIGFILLAGLFFTYFWYTNKQQVELENYRKHFDDSVAMVKSAAEKAAALKKAATLDSNDITNNRGVADTANLETVKEQFTILENELVKVT